MWSHPSGWRRVLRRRFAPTIEVVNDRSRDVATFFRILQRHYQAFLDMMRWQLTTRQSFSAFARPSLIPRRTSSGQRAFTISRGLASGARWCAGPQDLRSRRRPLRPSISRVWARSSRSCICVWPESRSRTWTMPGFAAPWLSADDTLLLRSAILRLGEGLRHRAVHAGRVRQPGRPAERSPVLVHPRRQRLTSDARLLRQLHPSSRYRRPTQSAATTSPNAYKSCW